MHTVRWVASKVIDHALSHIRLQIKKTQNYDTVSKILHAKHREGGAALVHDQMLFNDAVKRAEVDDMLEALARVAKMNSKIALIENIDSACEVLSINCANAVRIVTSRLKSFDRNSYALELREMTDKGLDILPLLNLQWEVAIRQLEQQSSLRSIDFSLDPDIIVRTKIKHVTDVKCALNIVTKQFLVSRSTIGGDHCANFCADNVHPSDAERSGCTLYFDWSGPVVRNDVIRPEKMLPSTLYAQSAWRFALRPGTTTGLTFNEVTFQAPIGSKEAPLVANMINSRGKSVSVKWR